MGCHLGSVHVCEVQNFAAAAEMSPPPKPLSFVPSHLLEQLDSTLSSLLFSRCPTINPSRLSPPPPLLPLLSRILFTHHDSRIARRFSPLFFVIDLFYDFPPGSQDVEGQGLEKEIWEIQVLGSEGTHRISRAAGRCQESDGRRGQDCGGRLR